MGRKNRINNKSGNIQTNLHNLKCLYFLLRRKNFFFRNEHNYYCYQSDVVINSIKLLESDEGKIPKMCFLTGLLCFYFQKYCYYCHFYNHLFILSMYSGLSLWAC